MFDLGLGYADLSYLLYKVERGSIYSSPIDLLVITFEYVQIALI